MITKFNFKSQVCTSIEQSRKLLKLGLKKRTADMCYSFDSVITQPVIPSDIFLCIIETDTENKNTIPAWSLHRLMCLVFNSGGTRVELFEDDDAYEILIYKIERLIKEGYFNKEYLG